MRNWTRFAPTESGTHGPEDHEGKREHHLGLKEISAHGGPVAQEAAKELRRRNKRKKI